MTDEQATLETEMRELAARAAKPWRLARSLQILRDQIDRAHPDRSKASDGTIADKRHEGIRSDHNPDARGIVLAMDITNDPQHEAHAALICEAIRRSRDPRVAYIIYNRFMLRSYVKQHVPAWMWATYTGPQPHDRHFHISVTSAGADDPALWAIG